MSRVPRRISPSSTIQEAAGEMLRNRHNRLAADGDGEEDGDEARPLLAAKTTPHAKLKYTCKVCTY